MTTRLNTGAGNWRLLGAGALLLVMTACGGGGSKHDDDDGDGDGGSEPPPPATLSLTFKGVVTDSPIANATVTATIGAQTFTATADANGAYSLPVTIDQDAAAGFVSLQARGSGSQSFVEFTSLAGSFAGLAAAAGSDGVLSSDENFATQITNVSTATAALLTEANGGVAPTTDAQLSSLGAGLDGQAVLDLATALKLAVDQAADYPLPAGVSTTQALVSSTAQRDSFVGAAAAKSPETFQQAQNAIAADPALTQPLTAAAVPAVLSAAMLSSDPAFSFNYNNRVQEFRFGSDGSGAVSSGSFDQPMSWALQGSTIQVSYAKPVETVSYEVVQCGDYTGQLETRYLSSGVSLSLLSSRTVAISETSRITYTGCPSLPSRSVTSTVARTILGDGDFEVLSNADIAGTVQTFYVYDAAQHAVLAEVADVAANGTGSTRFGGLSFTWALDGGAVEVSFSDGSQARYRRFREVDAFADDLFYEIDTADGRYVDAGASIDVDPDYAPELTTASLPGRYYQFGVGNEADPQPGVKGFRLRLDADGGGAQEDDYLQDGVVVTVDDSNSPYAGLHWALEGQNVVVRRTFANDGTQNCVPGTTGCTVYDERTIVPLVADDNGRVYVIERRRTRTDGIDASTPLTSLARYYDFEPPTVTAASSIRPTPSAAVSPQRGAQPR